MDCGKGGEFVDKIKNDKGEHEKMNVITASDEHLKEAIGHILVASGKDKVHNSPVGDGSIDCFLKMVEEGLSIDRSDS
jgi:hypothetical protein